MLNSEVHSSFVLCFTEMWLCGSVPAFVPCWKASNSEQIVTQNSQQNKRWRNRFFILTVVGVMMWQQLGSTIPHSYWSWTPQIQTMDYSFQIFLFPVYRRTLKLRKPSVRTSKKWTSEAGEDLQVCLDYDWYIFTSHYSTHTLWRHTSTSVRTAVYPEHNRTMYKTLVRHLDSLSPSI